LLDQAEILFSGLSSDYKRKQLFVNKFDVINPVKVTLKTTSSAAASEVDLENKSSIGYYVPFAKSLEKLIKVIPLSEKLTYASDSNDLKTDIFDGKYIKEKLNLKSNKNQFIFLIYCDDLELVNPIGSHRLKHKISNYIFPNKQKFNFLNL